MSRTPRNIDDPKLAALLVGRRAFVDDPMFVVDVGASGGIEQYWHTFADQLEAVGFDPLTSEMARLNEHAPPGVRYVAAWVTSRSQPASDDVPSTQFFQRTSAVRAAEIASLNFARAHYNAGQPLEWASDRVVLDDYFDDEQRARIDFLKVDTDGADYDVLLGADDLLRNGRVLGLAVEAQFHGPVGPDANLFSNIDGYLRARGFSLFELEVYRYSRGALPAPFQLEIPAQTVTGQVSWGEAIYLRDLGDEAYERMWGFEPSRVDLYKLISMFEIFGLVDCAAELVLKYGPHLGSETDCAAFLDVLAGEQSGTGMSYAALQREFAEDARRRFSGGHS